MEKLKSELKNLDEELGMIVLKLGAMPEPESEKYFNEQAEIKFDICIRVLKINMRISEILGEMLGTENASGVLIDEPSKNEGQWEKSTERKEDFARALATRKNMEIAELITERYRKIIAELLLEPSIDRELSKSLKR